MARPVRFGEWYPAVIYGLDLAGHPAVRETDWTSILAWSKAVR